MNGSQRRTPSTLNSTWMAAARTASTGFPSAASKAVTHVPIFAPERQRDSGRQRQQAFTGHRDRDAHRRCGGLDESSEDRTGEGAEQRLLHPGERSRTGEYVRSGFIPSLMTPIP